MLGNLQDNASIEDLRNLAVLNCLDISEESPLEKKRMFAQAFYNDMESLIAQPLGFKFFDRYFMFLTTSTDLTQIVKVMSLLLKSREASFNQEAATVFNAYRNYLRAIHENFMNSRAETSRLLQQPIVAERVVDHENHPLLQLSQQEWGRLVRPLERNAVKSYLKTVSRELPSTKLELLSLAKYLRGRAIPNARNADESKRLKGLRNLIEYRIIKGLYQNNFANPVYQGDLRDAVPNGYGRTNYPSGVSHLGDHLNGKLHGPGRFILGSITFEGTWDMGEMPDNGFLYHGQLVDDKRHGHGKLQWREGHVYEGQWQNNSRNGEGKYTGANGDVYQGSWINGNIHGQGTYSWANGEIYEGQFENYTRNGEGKCTSTNGNVYQGSWINDKKHGQGTLTYANGDEYTGEFVNDQRHGKGLYMWASGFRTHAEHQWTNNVMANRGKLYYANGDEYEGDFDANGARHGKGTYRHSNGNSYTGDWSEGLRHGKGTHNYATGDSYTGDWSNDQKHGKGSGRWSDGETYTGTWDKGVKKEETCAIM